MKKLLLLLLVLYTQTACQPAQAVLSTPTSTSIPAPQSETLIDTIMPKPTRTLDMSGYKLLVGDIVNHLRPVAVNDGIIYLADQSFDMLFMISSEMLIELIPPYDELYTLRENKDLIEIRDELYPQALMGEFVDREEINRAGCIVPLGITTGDEVLCGFSIVLKNSEVSVVILGTTLREGVNTPAN